MKRAPLTITKNLLKQEKPNRQWYPAQSDIELQIYTEKIYKLSKGAIERSFGIFLGFHEHFTQRWFKMAGKKVCDGSIEEKQLILRRK